MNAQAITLVGVERTYLEEFLGRFLLEEEFIDSEDGAEEVFGRSTSDFAYLELSPQEYEKLLKWKEQYPKGTSFYVLD